jgi:hypothetical protein
MAGPPSRRQAGGESSDRRAKGRAAMVGLIWIAVTVLGLIDALRHPASDWDYADRNRPFWVIFMFFFGPLFLVPYLVAVRPRFPTAAIRDELSPFAKR